MHGYWENHMCGVNQFSYRETAVQSFLHTNFIATGFTVFISHLNAQPWHVNYPGPQPSFPSCCGVDPRMITSRSRAFVEIASVDMGTIMGTWNIVPTSCV